MNDTRDVELNAIGVLKRREIEARILAPVVEALGREFGREKVRQIVRETIVGIAKDQGRQFVQIGGGNSVQQFAAVLPSWTKEDALEIEVVVQNEDELRFNVTRCRYAEMYESLGLSELGAILSCGRDAALIEGFNSNISFERTQTILGGASHCDFHYARRKPTSSGDQGS
jgi:L-2-amino-thiazoline-4-carboxylic acid hydrolase